MNSLWVRAFNISFFLSFIHSLFLSSFSIFFVRFCHYCLLHRSCFFTHFDTWRVVFFLHYQFGTLEMVQSWFDHFFITVVVVVDAVWCLHLFLVPLPLQSLYDTVFSQCCCSTALLWFGSFPLACYLFWWYAYYLSYVHGWNVCKNYIKGSDRTIQTYNQQVCLQCRLFLSMHRPLFLARCISVVSSAQHFVFYCTCFYLFKMLFYFIWIVFFPFTLFAEPKSRFSCNIWYMISGSSQTTQQNSRSQQFHSGNGNEFVIICYFWIVYDGRS